MSEFPKGLALFRADQYKTPCIYILEYIGIHETYLKRYLLEHIGIHISYLIKLYTYIIGIVVLRQSDFMSHRNQLI